MKRYFHKYRFELMIITFQELTQNWVIKVRLNTEFLQFRKVLKISINILGHFILLKGSKSP